ncbi:hypothetical protein EMIHUDRAFT_448921 [Emiliania huxleyi CCMP1516]|uniref:Rhodanese domain-containing protein n=2 Tax=Emiliania huxleyi TaxID=2903 RepID=A0A0D3KV98_EMIH1|nr:hypothetical protein EMIHUDRAFT_448921 [Emiliania huxleyi CCMP1516]EOD39683.1 hypothetical protein EMIHUDRAFT_448921 [Emiliania huxleyi CCMP1516]|eukprot:XP_005792112.1 hypothetical protein EMIHUDRAFT_448921 [Emiliania huxleyi CCMP1516]
MLLRPPVRQLALLLSCQFGAARRLPGTGCASLRFVTAAAAIRAAVPVPAPVLSINPKLDATLPYRALAFYAISPIAQPDEAVESHRAFLTKRGMVGRVYLCEDGINAQVSGAAEQCAEYRAYCHDQLGPGAAPEPILFKEDPCDELAFPRLRVKHRSLVPSGELLGGGASGRVASLQDRGRDVSPAEWEELLAKADGGGEEGGGGGAPIVLDVRNGYEWDERAETPVREGLRGTTATPTYFGARLRAAGFEKVYKLQGGVQHYGNAHAAAEEAPPRWKGSLFVPLGGASSEVVGQCVHCGAPTEAFVNCGNIDCNKLHLVCEHCLPRTGGFCCEPCSTAPRRRPPVTSLADLAATQGAPPGQPDPNRLSSVKPHNVGRKEYDADEHGCAPAAGSEVGGS